jgi:hypothetical protein
VRQPRDGPVLAVSYLTLRRALGILGISLPIILFTWGLLGDRVWLASISGYYSLRARDALVGCLCAIGCFLFTYHGYDRHDDAVTRSAGTCAVLVALVPSVHPGWQHEFHFIAAGIFFVLLAYISYYRFTRSGDQPTDAKLRRNRLYRTCAIVMLACVVLIPLFDLTHLSTRLAALRPTFVFETLALWAFGLSWLVKGGTLWRDTPNAARAVA